MCINLMNIIEPIKANVYNDITEPWFPSDTLDTSIH